MKKEPMFFFTFIYWYRKNIYEIQDLLAFWNNGISRIFKTCVFFPFKKSCADKVCIITFETKKF